MLDQQTAQFLAVAGEERALGATPREALDALMARLPVETLPPIMILPYNRGDAYFTDAQQARLQELKSRRDTLTVAEREEWEQLVEAAFNATIARAKAIPVVKM